MIEVLQLFFNTIASPLLLATTITYLVAQCSRKPKEPEVPLLKEPPYPYQQLPPEPGVLPTEDQYVYFNAPLKSRPEEMPTQEVIAQLIATHEAAQDEETRRKWGEEYCKAHPPKPPNPAMANMPKIYNPPMPSVFDKSKTTSTPGKGGGGRRTRASKTPSVQAAPEE